MGQNSSKESSPAYSSEQYFQQQVEFYQWRADPKLNTHIARVTFQPLSQLRDRARLRDFLQGSANEEHYDFSELRRLAGGKGKGECAGEEVMGFQQYACRLGELRERLSLGETLYALQTMLAAYELLLAKAGRVRADLECCFVTVQGELRIWLNRDYRSNQLENTDEGTVATSEMALIKKAVEMAQQLALNHTEFLHFSRQFRSLMERDILQNWNFSNSRKLINSYTYAYKLHLPTSLREALTRYTPTYAPTPAPSETSFELSRVTLKEEMMSTGSGMMRERETQRRKENGMNEWRREFVQTEITRQQQMEWRREHIQTEGSKDYTASYPQNRKETNTQQSRPLSQGDLNSKSASGLPSQASIKLHSKKFSSIDIKIPVHRNNGCESPKASHLQLKAVKGECSLMPTQRLRRERQSSGMDHSGRTGPGVRFSPVPSVLFQSPAMGSFQSDKPHAQQKQQKDGQRRRLQKKTMTATKYIQFFQNQSQGLQINQNSNQQTSRLQNCTISNIAHYTPNHETDQNVSPTSSLLTHIRNKHSEPNMVHLLSCDPTPSKDMLIMRGRTEVGLSQCPSQDATRSPYGCLTIKTVNNLLDNQVSLHESNGSFMSLPQSQASEYQGLLCQMGRSVDVLHLPSNKQILPRKNSSNGYLNRSNQ